MVSRMDKNRKSEDRKRMKCQFFLNRARDFREKRLEVIQKGGVWNGRSPGPYCILHWMPMPPTEDHAVDIEEISKKDRCRDFIFIKENLPVKSCKNRHGLWIGTSDKEGAGGCDHNFPGYFLRGFRYTQIFRSGELEAVYAPLLKSQKGKDPIYLSIDAFNFFREQIKNCIKKAPTLGFSESAIIGVTILGVKGYRIYTPKISEYNLSQEIFDDADEVHNSANSDIKLEHRISSITDIGDINEEILRPIFNKIWECFGFPECDRDFQDGS